MKIINPVFHSGEYYTGDVSGDLFCISRIIPKGTRYWTDHWEFKSSDILELIGLSNNFQICQVPLQTATHMLLTKTQPPTPSFSDYIQNLDKNPKTGEIQVNLLARCCVPKHLTKFFDLAGVKRGYIHGSLHQVITPGKLYHITQINYMGDVADVQFISDTGQPETMMSDFFTNPETPIDPTANKLVNRKIYQPILCPFCKSDNTMAYDYNSWDADASTWHCFCQTCKKNYKVKYTNDFIRQLQDVQTLDGVSLLK